MFNKRILRMLATMLVLILAIGNVALAESSDPTEIDLYTILYVADLPEPFLLREEVEKLTNTKLNITFSPNSGYDEKQFNIMASGDLPDAMMVQSPKNPTIYNAAQSNMFWDIEPYIDQFENLAKMNKSVFDNIRIDGKIYGLYRERVLARYGVGLRKDWLENLGIAPDSIKTVADLRNVLEQFTTGDPDGNGMNDTMGLSDREDLFSFTVMKAFFGAPNQWKIEDGKAVPDFMTQEYMDCLDYYRDLYASGFLNRDFAITKTADLNASINAGKYGAFIGAMSDGANFINEIRKVNPDCDFVYIGMLDGPNGPEKVHTTAGYNGMYVFPKSSVKDEAELLGILKFFNDLCNEDTANALAMGIEDLHYSLDAEGNLTRTPEQTTAYDNEVVPLHHLKISEMNKTYKEIKTPWTVLSEENAEKYVSLANHNPCEPYISATQMEKGNELKQIMTDAMIQYVMGEIDKAGFEKAQQQWLSQGGEQIITEYTEAYTSAQ